MRKTVVAVALLLAFAGTAGADDYNLSTLGQSYWINGALFASEEQKPEGTGYIDPFLKFTTNSEQTQAYNYDRKTWGDVTGNTSYGTANWTTLVETATLEVYEMPNEAGVLTDYWKFALDIDQTKSSGGHFALDYLTFSTSDDDSYHAPITGIDNPPTLPTFPSLGTQFYTMGDNHLMLFYALNSGSGSGDLYVYVPVPASYGDYLYLANALGYKESMTFGATTYDTRNNDGPDEWAAYTSEYIPDVPDGGSMVMLLGMALIGLGGIRRMLK